MSFLPDKQVYQSKTDIFGNQYFLLKDRGYSSLYAEKRALGQVWIKDQRNFTQPLSTAIPSIQESFGVFKTSDCPCESYYYYYTYMETLSILSDTIIDGDLNVFTTLDAEVDVLPITDISVQIASGFRNMDVMFDILELETRDFVLFTKINFNYDVVDGSGISFEAPIYTTTDESCIFCIGLGKYAGHWFFPEEKRITFCIVQSSDKGFIYPSLYSLDIDEFTVTNILLSAEISPLITQTTALHLTSFEQPVFTYNKDTRTYNIAFICKGTTYENIIVESIYLTQLGDSVQYTSVVAFTPNS
jgi:hypothetical protein